MYILLISTKIRWLENIGYLNFQSCYQFNYPRLLKYNEKTCPKRIAALQLYSLREPALLDYRDTTRIFSQNDCFYWRRLLVPPFF